MCLFISTISCDKKLLVLQSSKNFYFIVKKVFHSLHSKAKPITKRANRWFQTWLNTSKHIMSINAAISVYIVTHQHSSLLYAHSDIIQSLFYIFQRNCSFNWAIDATHSSRRIIIGASVRRFGIFDSTFDGIELGTVYLLNIKRSPDWWFCNFKFMRQRPNWTMRITFGEVLTFHWTVAKNSKSFQKIFKFKMKYIQGLFWTQRFPIKDERW